MYKLFIDTHNTNIIYAVYDDTKLVNKIIISSTSKHGDVAMPILVSFLDKLNIDIHQIKEIIVNNGPGSFTGVRIGVTIAKMFAYTLNIPIKTISSLELYSLNNDGKVLVTLKDSKGFYCANFDNHKLIDDMFYLNKDDFNIYIKNNKCNVIETEDINFNKLGVYINDIKSTNVHMVKPLYVKVIEALK